MEKPSKVDTALLQRYANGTCNAQEQALVEAWLASERLSEAEQSPWDIAGQRSIRNNIWTTIAPTAQKKRRMAGWLNWAALWALLAVGLIWWYTQPSINQEVITVAAGEQRCQTLPDGSVVQLNGGSELHFSRPFDERKVFLSGEARFIVNKKAAQPFVVETAQGLVTVLGTTFHVSTFPEENIPVSVLQGKIRYADKRSAFTAVLKANEALICDSLHHLQVATIQASEQMLWTEGVLYFNHETMGHAIKKIERWFGVHIRLDDPQFKQETFKGRFKQPTLAQVLRSICFGLNARYEQTAQGITIIKK